MRVPKDNPFAKTEMPRASRRERVPFGQARTKLGVKGLPDNTVGRWVNDSDSRIQEMLDRGYRFVDKDGVFVGEDIIDGNASLDTRVSKIVGRDESGRPLTAHLMAIPKDFHEEDQAAKNQEINELDTAIREGQLSRSAGDNRYVPHGGISIKDYKP